MKHLHLAGKFGMFAVAFLLILSACTEANGVYFEKTELSIRTTGGITVSLSAELAITDEQRARGLMLRENLDDGYGMLFIFAQDQILNFWMENTQIPLSIAFISSDGIILEIRDLQPFDRNPVRSSRSGRFALEVPQGWFDRAGIAVGDSLLITDEIRL
jgi:uncharacterized membrane protein (UPF0127 family)